MTDGSIAPLSHVGRKSLVDSVVETITARILRGEIAPGEALPSEQELALRLGVSRTAVREALNRLATARLVSIRHSGSKHVLDYRQSAGLELLATLLIAADGKVDATVVKSVMEMRSALAPDIARLAASRRRQEHLKCIGDSLALMRAAGDDLERLQDLVSELWDHLVDASGNIAYRLAYNSLRASYEQSKRLLTRVLAEEVGDVAAYEALVAAVSRQDTAAAESRAREIIRRGEVAVSRLFTGFGGSSERVLGTRKTRGRGAEGPRVQGKGTGSRKSARTLGPSNP